MRGKVLSGARLVPLALIVLLLMVGVVPAAMAQGPGDDEAEAQGWTGDGVRFNPQNTVLLVGQPGETEVEVVNTLNLYAVSFTLGVPAGFNIDSITPGSLFDGLCSSCFLDQSNPTTGQYSITLVGNVAPISGTGSIARITWAGPAGVAGPVPLTFNQVNLSDRFGNSIGTGPVVNGNLQAVAAGAVVTGQVKMQSRNGAMGGTTVQLYTPGTTPTAIGGASALTGANGEFSIPAIVGLVDVYAPPLVAGARPAVDGFLPTRARGISLSGGTYDLGTVVRLAGDVTPNGEVSGCPAININDLSAIAGTLYDGVCDAAHDLNGSGGADCDDIFDLALAAANYGQRGYVDWLTGTVDNCQ